MTVAALVAAWDAELAVESVAVAVAQLAVAAATVVVEILDAYAIPAFAFVHSVLSRPSTSTTP